MLCHAFESQRGLNEKTMENYSMKLIVTELILLILTNILQIVSLTTPGWYIQTGAYSETRSGIFYTETCSRKREEWDCETKSWLDVYHEHLADVRLNRTIYSSGPNTGYVYAGKIIIIIDIAYVFLLNNNTNIYSVYLFLIQLFASSG